MPVGMVAVITILEACPCAAITTLFAIKFGHDQKLAVGAVTLSTLISIITLPLSLLFAGVDYNVIKSIIRGNNDGAMQIKED